ncbi:MAG: hypothetical protein HY305_00200, partial [Sphingobacteriales bacterium]|nr:hypothetical protein [Sphingobacteriales bacterium]
SITPSVSTFITQTNGANGNLAGSLGAGYTYSSRMGMTGMHLDASVTKSKQQDDKHYNCFNPGEPLTGSLATLNSGLSFAYPSIMPSVKNKFTNSSYSLGFAIGTEVYGINANARVGGFYTKSEIADADTKTTHPAYGVLYYQKANSDVNALLDFNRSNDGIYTPESPTVGMPIYTYDIFSINGEGTGGVFKACRNDLGYVRDAYVKTKDNAGSLGLNLGFGNTLHLPKWEAGIWEIWQMMLLSLKAMD